MGNVAAKIIHCHC